MSSINNTNTGRYAMPPKLYDFLKDLAQLYLPATGTFYAALAPIWGWSLVLEITGTILATTTFLGATLKLSKISYDNSDKSKDGDLKLVVNTEGEIDLSSVALDSLTGSDLETNSRVVLNVKRVDAEPTSTIDPRLLKNSQN